MRLLPGQFLEGTTGMPSGSYTKVVRYRLGTTSASNKVLSSAVGGIGTHAFFHGSTEFPRMFHGGTTAMEAIVVAATNAATNLGSIYVNGIPYGSGTAADDNASTSYQLGASDGFAGK